VGKFRVGQSSCSKNWPNRNKLFLAKCFYINRTKNTTDPNKKKPHEKMPRIHRNMSMSQNTVPLTQDKNGKLLKMQIAARATVFGAQFLRPPSPSNEVYRMSINKAIDITKKEREGWLQIDDEAFPDGDWEGAGKASMSISGFYLEIDELEAAITWCVRARKDFCKHCSDNNVTESNLDFIMRHVEYNRQQDLRSYVFQSWASCAYAKKLTVLELVD